MKYKFHIFMSLMLFLGIILIVLEATFLMAVPYGTFTSMNKRHNYPIEE